MDIYRTGNSYGSENIDPTSMLVGSSGDSQQPPAPDWYSNLATINTKGSTEGQAVEMSNGYGFNVMPSAAPVVRASDTLQASLEERKKAIENEIDPAKKLMATINLQTDVAQLQTTRLSEAVTSSMAKYQVPEIEAKLKQATLVAAATGDTEGKEVKTLQQALQQAKGQALQEADLGIKTDIPYQTSLQSHDSFIKLTLKTSEDTLNKANRQEDIAQAKYESEVSPQAASRLSSMIPGFDKLPYVDRFNVVNHIKSNPNTGKADWSAIVAETSPETVIQALSGNPLATQFVIKDTVAGTKSTGIPLSPETVAKNLDQIKTTIDSQPAFDEAWRRVYKGVGMDATTEQGAMKMSMDMKAKSPNAKDRAEVALYRGAIAAKDADVRATESLKSDVTTHGAYSPLNDPILKEAYSKVGKDKVSVTDLAIMAASMVKTPGEKMQMIDRALAGYDKAIVATQGRLFGRADSLDIGNLRSSIQIQVFNPNLSTRISNYFSQE